MSGLIILGPWDWQFENVLPGLQNHQNTVHDENVQCVPQITSAKS